MPSLQIPSKLERFVTTPKRYKIAFGGRGAGKSQTFADIFLMKSQIEQAKIGCFREFQNSIDDSVHSLLSDEIRRLSLNGFSVLNNEVKNEDGGEFRFKGLSRNPDAVQSMNAFNYFWIEEGHSITKKSFEKLDPTLRKEGSELWVSMNPQSSLDYMSQRFIEPFKSDLLSKGSYEDDEHLIVLINYCDNPWFPSVLDQVRQNDYKRLPRAEYNHIWLGYYNDSIEGSIITPEWFDAAIDAHKKLNFKPTGAKIAAYDPADSGDAKAYVKRHGVVITEIEESTTGDVNSSTDWALDACSDVDHFTWDATGIGLSLRRQISQAVSGRKIQTYEFNGAATAQNPTAQYERPEGDSADKPMTNKDVFINIRAQRYWELRDRFYKTFKAVEEGEYINPDELISISSDCTYLEKLKAEVCRIPKQPTGTGKIQIMRKDLMKSKYNIDSPNVADALMMCMGTYSSAAEGVNINFASGW